MIKLPQYHRLMSVGLQQPYFKDSHMVPPDNDDCGLLSCLTVLTAWVWVLVIVFVLVPATP